MNGICGIHRQDIVGLGRLIKPRLNLCCFAEISLAGDLDTRLKLAYADGGQVNFRVGDLP
jgi:hypothetical protein